MTETLRSRRAILTGAAAAATAWTAGLLGRAPAARAGTDGDVRFEEHNYGSLTTGLHTPGATAVTATGDVGVDATGETVGLKGATVTGDAGVVAQGPTGLHASGTRFGVVAKAGGERGGAAIVAYSEDWHQTAALDTQGAIRFGGASGFAAFRASQRSVTVQPDVPLTASSIVLATLHSPYDIGAGVAVQRVTKKLTEPKSFTVTLTAPARAPGWVGWLIVN